MAGKMSWHAYRWSVVAVLAACLWAPAGVSASPPSVGEAPSLEATGEEDAALILAVENYAFLPDVPGARQTATDWETLFVDGMGIDRSKVFVRLDESVTRSDMLKFAERARSSVGPEGTLWFVFVGHGAPSTDGESGMLVGVDAQSDPQMLEQRSLSRQEMIDALEQGEQRRTVAVIDACFSGRAHGGGEALAKGVQPVVPSNMDESYRAGEGTVVFSAAKSDQFAGALPGADRPAFSYLMLGALRGWADGGDGRVTAGEALDFTRQYLRHLDRTQTPQLKGDPESVLAAGAREETPDLSSAFRASGELPPEGDRASEEARPPEVSDPQPGPERSVETCEPGQIRVSGHCCWPGQRWNGSSCTGEPAECPGGRIKTSQGCELPTCSEGRVRAPDGVHCCWDGQTWSEQAGMCVGEPNCPEGYLADGRVCERDTDGDGVKDELDECPETPEDDDGVADFDGCPEEDADGDGIPDEADECPEEGEDFDGFRDDDGCPEARNGSVAAGVTTTIVGGGLTALGGTGLVVASGSEQPSSGLEVGSAITTGAGALTGIIGAITWATDPDVGAPPADEEGDARAKWRVGVGPRGVRLGVRFR